MVKQKSSFENKLKPTNMKKLKLKTKPMKVSNTDLKPLKNSIIVPKSLKRSDTNSGLLSVIKNKPYTKQILTEPEALSVTKKKIPKIKSQTMVKPECNIESTSDIKNNETKPQKNSSKDSAFFSVIQNKLHIDRLMKDYVVQEEEAAPVPKQKISKKKMEKLNRIKERKENSLPAKHPDDEERTIYVGNVNIKTKQRKVSQFFSKYGEVESVRFRGAAAEKMNMTKKEAIVTKKLHPQQASIIAYVRFKDKESKEKALEANGQLFEGLHIRVDSAIRGRHQEKKSIFVGNLAWEAKDEDLWNMFKGCGEISNVRVVRSSTTGAGKGIAFISFDSEDSVELALYYDGKPLKERPLRVKRATKKGREKEVKPKPRKSGVSSLFREKPNPNRMRISFLKQDKPRNFSKKEKHGKRKALQSRSGNLPATNFSGWKAVQDGEPIKKKKRSRKTKTEKQKFLLAKKLAATN